MTVAPPQQPEMEQGGGTSERAASPMPAWIRGYADGTGHAPDRGLLRRSAAPQQLLETSPPPDRPGSIALMLWRAADSAGDRIAIVERDRAVSYADLRARAAGIANGLACVDVRPGDRVGILLPRGIEAAAAYFGALAAGGVPVMLNEVLRPRQIEHLVSDAGARVLLTNPGMLERQPRALSGPVHALDVADLPEWGTFSVIPRRFDDVAQIIYTSGSTGLPKGVVHSHANLWAWIEVVVGYLGIVSTDRVASLLPFSSVYGLNQLLCAVLAAATLVVEQSPLPQECVLALREGKVTVVAGVPPLWLQILATEAFARALPSLRVLQNAGGHLPVEAVRGLRAAQPQAKLFLQYGLTEVLRSTYLPPEEVDRRPTSIGRAVHGAEVHVLRPDLTPCAPGEVGELVHCGPTVAFGYWNQPDATAGTFRSHPLLAESSAEAVRAVFSGDLVRRDEEGYLYFVGREDHMIKTLGYRVGPDEVTAVLHASGQVAEAAVSSEPDRVRGERIVAHVVLAPGGSMSALNVFCRSELPRHMQPVRFEVLAELPRLPGGKFDLQALRGVRRPS